MRRLLKNLSHRKTSLHVLLAIAAGLFIHLFYPAGPYPALALLGYWGWLFLLNKSVLKECGAKTGFFVGLSFGFTFYLVLGFNLYPALLVLLDFSSLKAVVFMMFLAGVHALPLALFGLIWGHRHQADSPLRPLPASIILTGLQLLPPALLPITPAHFLYDTPSMFQLLDLGGVPLLLLLLNLAGFSACRLTEAKRFGLGIVAIFSVILGYGYFQKTRIGVEEQQADSGRFVEVAAIQPNVPVVKNGVPLFVQDEDGKNSHKTALELSFRAATSWSHLDLIVWPELPQVIRCDRENAVLREIQTEIRAIGKPLLFTCEQEAADKRGFYNTAAFVDRSGTITGKYNKKRLLPFGEYLPFENALPFLRQFFVNTRYYIPGEASQVFELSKTLGIVPAICYESFFPSHLRSFLADHSPLLVNMSNEGYFGPNRASLIALSLTVFRSVEYRLPVLRTTNSGNSAAIDALGQIVPGSKSPLFQKWVGRFRLFVPENRSLYARFGRYQDWLLALLFGFTLVFVFFPRQRLHR